MDWNINVFNVESKNIIEDRFQHSVKHRTIKREGKSYLTTKGVTTIIHNENKARRETPTLIINRNTFPSHKMNKANTPWQCV